VNQNLVYLAPAGPKGWEIAIYLIL